MQAIDFRSDTCSWPDDEMREAMAAAPVGNASWDEDPSVVELERLACEVTGKESALFCCSGTMANLAAAMTYASRSVWGAEVIMADYCHTYWYEVGGISNLARFTVRTVPSAAEYLPVAAVAEAIRPRNGHMPRTSLLWVENTFMLGGGEPITAEKMGKLRALAHEHALPVHLDGARIFNAAVALRVEVADLCSFADSVQFCLSKGLGAPFGSLLCGRADFIEDARRYRQGLGGGLRQGGIMAAAGTLGIRRAPAVIGRAHGLARRLAEGLAQRFPGGVNLEATRSNMVLLDPAATGRTGPQLAADLERGGVRTMIVPTPHGPKCRFMTYPNITDDDVAAALDVFDRLDQLDH